MPEIPAPPTGGDDTPIDAPAPIADALAPVADETPAPAATPAPATASAPALDTAHTAQQLKQRFPALFVGAARPIKLRIQLDIQERAPGVFTKQALSAFFRRYTGSTSYLIAVSRGAQRFDLDGAPAGELSDEHRQAALDELNRRRGNQVARQEAEENERRARAGLLRAFETTTLTKANFCALKGVEPDALDRLLELARGEAQQRAAQTPMFEARRGRDDRPRRGVRHRRPAGRAGPR